MRRLRIAALALALAAGSALAQETLRPEVATPAKAANEALGAGRFAEALAKVKEAEAVSARTPYENFILDQLRAAASAGAGDLDTAMASYDAVLATKRLSPEDTVRILEGLVGSANQKKDYTRAADYARRYLQAGGANPQVRRVLVNSLYQKSDFAGAAKEVQALVGEDEAAGRRPAEELLRLLGASQLKLNDNPGYLQTLERLLRHHPKPAYWRDRIAQLQRAPGFDEALTIDAYRLLKAAGAMEDANDFIVLAELATRAGLPAEAQAALDAGFAAGKLGTGNDAAAHKALRDRATRDAAADAKEFDRDLPPAPTSSANALVNQGIALATSGRAERGITFIEQGLAKPGLPRADAARLRFAWVQAQAGRKAPAEAQLKELQAAGGTAGDLARLWLIQLSRPAQ